MSNFRKPLQHMYVVVFISGLAGHAQAVEQTPFTQWDRSSAMAAVRSVDIDSAVREIGGISTLSDADGTLGRLRALQDRGDWPLPAREAALFRFTQSLAELPRAAVATEVMRHLTTFQAQTLVPHEDHGDGLIPLFNIRGAATGVENGWQRTEFSTLATIQIETNPEAMLRDFIESDNPNLRTGYQDALRHSKVADVIVVKEIAVRRLGEAPALSSLVATTAIITGDIDAIQVLLVSGQGAGLSSTLVQLDKQLPLSETLALLEFAIDQAPAGNTALAIAAWWPRLRHEPRTRDLMMGLLGDPSLGANAALALAQNPDVQTIKDLQDAADGDSPSARRAKMALDLNRSQLLNEVQK